LPRRTGYNNGRISLTGPEESSRPGEWWYYFQREFDLFVFAANAEDPQGPILAAASRALFANIHMRPLEQIAEMWDKAVAGCSDGRMFATCLQINVELGEGRIISAGGKLPAWQLTPSGQSTGLLVEPNFPLGARKGLWLGTPVQLAPGEEIRLYLGENTAAHVSVRFSSVI
jgi:hypothetical protein